MRLSLSRTPIVAGLVLVAVVAVLVVALGAGSTAQAGGSDPLLWRNDNSGIPVRVAPDSGSRARTTMPNGTPVTMLRYCDAGWATGNYRSNRWFKVSFTRYTGWVHSSLIRNQKRVPQGCS